LFYFFPSRRIGWKFRFETNWTIPSIFYYS
jgi:hypothetical protein